MMDVQVSNARRISLTAVVVVAFWVLAWRAYSTGGRSWFWLLLPIIVTTAFVIFEIFGAWRRAVRDAEVDAINRTSA